MVRYEMQRLASRRYGATMAWVGQAGRQALQLPQCAVAGAKRDDGLHRALAERTGADQGRALGGLIGAQSRNPTRSAGKGAVERLYLAQSTASEPGFQRMAETVYAIAFEKFFNAFSVWGEPANCSAVAAFRTAPDLQGLRK